MNYVSAGRTSYFKVKDIAAFKAWVAAHPGLKWVEHSQEKEHFCLLAEEGFTDHPDTEESVTAGIQKHLLPEEVAIFMETGQEGMRYMAGWAAVVTADGEIANLDLSDIYLLAANRLKRDICTIPRVEY